MTHPRRGAVPAWIIAGTLGVVAGIVAWILGPRTLPDYLFAFVFWTGIALGSLSLAMVQRITGGAWGDAIAPALQAGMRALALAALLAVPVLITAGQLYPWLRESYAASNTWYLQDVFFLLRTAVYFTVWIALAHAVGAWRRGGPDRSARAARASAGGLVILALTVTLAAFDWVMSLAPDWFSGVFGLLVWATQVASALALAILLAVTIGPARHSDQVGARQTLGSLLLALVLLWGYLAFMQLATIWIADLPVEIGWYLPRLDTSWRWVGASVLALHALAVLLLLLRHAKRSRAGLATAAGAVWVGQLAYTAWLILPTIRPDGVGLGGTTAAALIAAGGLLAAGALYRRRPHLQSDASRSAIGGVKHG